MHDALPDLDNLQRAYPGDGIQLWVETIMDTPHVSAYSPRQLTLLRPNALDVALVSDDKVEKPSKLELAGTNVRSKWQGSREPEHPVRYVAARGCITKPRNGLGTGGTHRDSSQRTECRGGKPRSNRDGLALAIENSQGSRVGVLVLQFDRRLEVRWYRLR
jgi:hypothetical protein